MDKELEGYPASEFMKNGDFLFYAPYIPLQITPIVLDEKKNENPIESFKRHLRNKRNLRNGPSRKI